MTNFKSLVELIQLQNYNSLNQTNLSASEYSFHITAKPISKTLEEIINENVYSNDIKSNYNFSKNLGANYGQRSIIK